MSRGRMRVRVAATAVAMSLVTAGGILAEAPQASADTSCSITSTIQDPAHNTHNINAIGWWTGLTVSGSCGYGGFVSADTWLEKYSCKLAVFCAWREVGKNKTAYSGYDGSSWAYFTQPWPGSGKYRAVIDGPTGPTYSAAVKL